MHDADKDEDAQSQADGKSSPIPPFGDSSQGHLVTILAGALGSGVWAIRKRGSKGAVDCRSSVRVPSRRQLAP